MNIQITNLFFLSTVLLFISGCQELEQINLDQQKNQKYKIIYGGSVNSKNVSELKKINDLKGFLIGSASLRAKNFIDIIKKSTN